MPQATLINILMLSAFPFVTAGFIYGLFVRDPRKDATEAIAHLGLKTAQDKVPQVVQVIELDEFRKKILVSSVGLGVDRYEFCRGA
jgi:hypothetical protein